MNRLKLFCSYHKNFLSMDSAFTVHPGTTKDIDFYFTTAHDATSFPPETAWSTIPQRGVDPAPRVLPGNSMMHQQQSNDQSKDYI